MTPLYLDALALALAGASAMAPMLILAHMIDRYRSPRARRARAHRAWLRARR